MVQDDATQVGANGWRQGSFLPTVLVNELVSDGVLEEPLGEGQQLVVISHDCDVANASYAKEPHVELLVARVVDPTRADKNLWWGKNPRRYQLEEKTKSGEPLIWEFSVHERKTIPRGHLACHQPGEQLNSDNVRELALWMARRYSRAAFPNALVERLRSAEEVLRKELKKKGDLLTGVYLHCPDDELPEDEPYKISIHGTIRVEDYEAPEKRANAQELLDRIEAEFAACQGVNVIESTLVSEEKFSADDMRYLKRWDFDYLTVRGDAASDLPPLP